MKRAAAASGRLSVLRMQIADGARTRARGCGNTVVARHSPLCSPDRHVVSLSLSPFSLTKITEHYARPGAFAAPATAAAALLLGITNRSSLRHALRLSSSFLRPHGRQSDGGPSVRPSVRPSVQPGTTTVVRPRVRSAADAVTDNNARFFDNLRRPRRPRVRVRCWRVRRGGEGQRRVTTAIIS